MEIAVTQEKGKVPVSVIHIKGELDAWSYPRLVNTAQALYSAGARSLLLNLTDLSFISSAGLASLHIITKMFRDEKVAPEDVWETFKKFDRDRERSLQNLPRSYYFSMMAHFSLLRFQIYGVTLTFLSSIM